jgi:hypothetical protein
VRVYECARGQGLCWGFVVGEESLRSGPVGYTLLKPKRSEWKDNNKRYSSRTDIHQRKSSCTCIEERERKRAEKVNIELVVRRERCVSRNERLVRFVDPLMGYGLSSARPSTTETRRKRSNQSGGATIGRHHLPSLRSLLRISSIQQPP